MYSKIETDFSNNFGSQEETCDLFVLTRRATSPCKGEETGVPLLRLPLGPSARRRTILVLVGLLDRASVAQSRPVRLSDAKDIEPSLCLFRITRRPF